MAVYSCDVCCMDFQFKYCLERHLQSKDHKNYAEFISDLQPTCDDIDHENEQACPFAVSEKYTDEDHETAVYI